MGTPRAVPDTYVQMSVARRSNQKLAYKYFGPFLITNKVGSVAYKLQLPASSSIHPVVHVSQLKKALPPNTEVQNDSELSCLSLISTPMPIHATQTKLCKKGNTVVPLVQVRWSNMPASWTTWENLNMLQ
jgi:hypothetical protein